MVSLNKNERTDFSILNNQEALLFLGCGVESGLVYRRVEKELK